MFVKRYQFTQKVRLELPTHRHRKTVPDGFHSVLPHIHMPITSLQNNCQKLTKGYSKHGINLEIKKI